MSLSFANRSNLDLLEENYQRWQEDPESLDPTWLAFFEGFELGDLQLRNGATAMTAAPVAAGAKTQDGLATGRARRRAQPDAKSNPPNTHVGAARQHFRTRVRLPAPPLLFLSRFSSLPIRRPLGADLAPTRYRLAPKRIRIRSKIRIRKRITSTRTSKRKTCSAVRPVLLVLLLLLVILFLILLVLLILIDVGSVDCSP